MEKYFKLHRNKILRQLDFCKKNVPFYKRALKNIDINKIKTYQDFVKCIPVITSEMYSSKPRDFKSDLPYKFIRHSSSTTGKPKKIYLTKSDLEHWVVAGALTITPYFKSGMVVAHTSREEKYYLSSLDDAVESSGGSIVQFDPINKIEIIDAIKKADIIIEYAEMIYYISEQIKDCGVNFKKRLILSYVGNIITRDELKIIRKNFQKVGIKISVFSEYSTSEAGPVGCSVGVNNNKFKIIYDDNVFVEVVRVESDKRKGEIVVTSLNRNGSVFVRYCTGDIGAFSFKKGYAYIDFYGRKPFDIKVASLFFSPQQVFHCVRSFLKSPVFCDIRVIKDRYKNFMKLSIVTESEVDLRKQKGIKNNLLRKLDFIDDLHSTFEIEIYFENRKFSPEESRKGFKFKYEKIN